MKNAKLRVLGLLALLCALIALGTYAYPRLTAWQSETIQTSRAQADPSQTKEPVATKKTEVMGPIQKVFTSDFTYYNVDGEAMKLSDLRGKPIIVNCFASWCMPCRSEMPHFDEAIQEYDGRICFLMLDINNYGNDTMEDALTMVQQLGLSFDVVFDSDGEAAKAYGLRYFPTTLFIAPDGALLETRIGAMTQSMLADEIEKLLETVE